MYFGQKHLCLLALLTGVAGERWRWPEGARLEGREGREGRQTGAQSVRIDTKVRFVDDAASNNNANNVQADEVPFKEPTDTEGFYNRPPGSGRYPVRVNTHSAPYRVNGNSVYPVTTYRPPSDGTLDSLQYCKCVSTLDCNPQADPSHACGSGQYLCCYKRPNKSTVQNSEYFNEIEDDRPASLPGRPNTGRPFAPLPNHDFEAFGQNQDNAFGNRPSTNRPELLIGPMGPTGQVGPPNNAILVGPNGPTGHIGPGQTPERLVGPNGPTGHIGPGQNPNILVGPNGSTGNIDPDILVGPNGPSGFIGPAQNPDVLVGPNGPTGVIGPNDNQKFYRPEATDAGPSASAQRGVLVGPGGPTGIIGPYNQRPVLVGPGGPTGFIGPNRGGYRGYNNRGILSGPGGPTGIIGPGYRRQTGRGLLVGPGGPTGTIGPGRQLLVGPGGPTGQIGPSRYFECEHDKRTSKLPKSLNPISKHRIGSPGTRTASWERIKQADGEARDSATSTGAARVRAARALAARAGGSGRRSGVRSTTMKNERNHPRHDSPNVAEFVMLIKVIEILMKIF